MKENLGFDFEMQIRLFSLTSNLIVQMGGSVVCRWSTMSKTVLNFRHQKHVLILKNRSAIQKIRFYVRGGGAPFSILPVLDESYDSVIRCESLKTNNFLPKI